MADKTKRKPLEVSGLRTRPPRRRWPWIFVPMIAAGGYVGVKIATDPGRAWAQRASTLRHDVLEAPFTTCFGSAESTAVRTTAEQVRANRTPPSFAACKDAALDALADAPAGFSAQLPAPPSRASGDHTQETRALKELGASLGRLRAVVVGASTDTPTEAEQRERTGRVLLEVAAMLDQERTAFARMTDNARAFKAW